MEAGSWKMVSREWCLEASIQWNTGQYLVKRVAFCRIPRATLSFNISAQGPKAPVACWTGECVCLCMCLSVCVFLHVPFCTSYWTRVSPGTPGKTRLRTDTEPLFSTPFSHRFFEWFFEGFGVDFGWLFWCFSHVFCIAFSTPIFKQVFLIFHICSFQANPPRHAFYCSPLVLKRFHPFRKSWFFSWTPFFKHT